jgi:hypothetical protein
MKKVFLSMISVLTMGIVAQAQQAWMIDSVSIGANAQDEYYSLKNGSQRIENSKNWHLGFTLSPIGDSAAVWANHQSGNAFTKVFNIHKDSTQWNTVTLADTAAANLCFNNDQGWYQGAFNDVPSSDPYNFGWGYYDAVSHNIVGDSIFIVRANGVYYKLIIEQLQAATAPVTWTFSYENLSTPAAAVQKTIVKSPKYDNNLFAYFNFATESDTNREPAIANWDFVINRYTTNSVGSGQGTNNNLVGVLTNKGVLVTKAKPVDVDTAYNNYLTYTTSMSKVISVIGWDWKTLVSVAPPFLYDVPDSTSYFMKDKGGDLWQMQPLAYSAGKMIFRKRMLFPLAVTNVNSNIQAMNVYPNPAHQNMHVLLDVKNASKVQVMIIDFTGKIVSSFSSSINSGLNALDIPCNHLHNGNYVLSIKGENMNITEKVTISK